MDVLSSLNSMSPEDVLSSVNSIKEEGNQFFRRKEYAEAESRYSFALHLLDNAKSFQDAKQHENALELTVTLLTNRAQTSLLQGFPDEAMQSCFEALSLKGNHEKALYRCGIAAARVGDVEVVDEIIPKIVSLNYEGGAKHAQEIMDELNHSLVETRDCFSCVVLVSDPTTPPCRVEPAVIPKDHEMILKTSTHVVCTALEGLGIFLVVVPMDSSSTAMNPMVQYLLCDPRSIRTEADLRAISQRSTPSQVLLFRRDGRRLSVTHVLFLWDYLSVLLQCASERGQCDNVMKETEFDSLYTYEGFDRFMRTVRKAFLRWK
eukprot:PhF_6_TR13544/c0_g1_i1/m.21646